MIDNILTAIREQGDEVIRAIKAEEELDFVLFRPVEDAEVEFWVNRHGAVTVTVVISGEKRGVTSEGKALTPEILNEIILSFEEALKYV